LQRKGVLSPGFAPQAVQIPDTIWPTRCGKE
jgi:hypothetical protein